MERGWYWVELLDPAGALVPGEAIEIAYWNGDYWLLAGSLGHFNDDTVRMLNPVLSHQENDDVPF